MAGGLGQYLGVDATVLRVGFVIASLLFLGGFGGPVLYVIAWLLVPEEGKDAAVTKTTFSGRPWHDWDRSARSWALVLGALALALIWSFGIWPWWHWRVLPFWLVGLAVALWLLARHREGNWSAAPPSWGRPAGTPPGPPPGSGPGPTPAPGPSAAPMPDPGAGPESGPEPVPGAEPAPPAAGGGPVTATTTSPPAVTSTAAAASSGSTITAPVNTNGDSPVDPGYSDTTTEGHAASGTAIVRQPLYTPVREAKPFGPVVPVAPFDVTAQTDADWAAAQTAAADWAAGQLALAGVATTSEAGDPSTGSAMARPSMPAQAARSLRRAVRVLVALIAALILLAVITVVGVTLGTGSSLSGGVGDTTYAPASISSVQPHYRLGAGNLDLNLSSVKFPATGKTVDVTVGLGNLTVEVPRDAVVTVQARSGIGQVEVFGRSGSDVQASAFGGPGSQATAPHLNLSAHVGMGDLQVTQS